VYRGIGVAVATGWFPLNYLTLIIDLAQEPTKELRDEIIRAGVAIDLMRGARPKYDTVSRTVEILAN
jgi:hypothetical protein